MEAIKINKRAIISKCYGKYIYKYMYIQSKHVDKILKASVIKKTKKNKQLDNKYAIDRGSSVCLFFK